LIERVTPTGAKPRIAASLGPPPKKLVVRKLKKGSGRRVRRGEQLGARFIDINYRTKRVQDFWEGGQGGAAPYLFALGEGEVRKGWEIALPGQRLGTRLELLLPSRLAYGEGSMRYVVELIELIAKPTPDRKR
jgi:peptidylprolyl isomerase